MRILMILIPDEDLPGMEPELRPTRVIEPYYLFQDGGLEIVLASPTGGTSWTRRQAERDGLPAHVAARYHADRNAHDAFADTLSLHQVFVDDVDAVFCVGKIASIWRSKPSDLVASVIADALTAGKPVAIIPDAIDIFPEGSGKGLLILGQATASPLFAAQALLRILQNDLLSGKETIMTTTANVTAQTKRPGGFTDLPEAATRDVGAALTGLLADVFTLYLKTKNFHWHMSGPHFRDYHLLLDEQGDELFAMTDPLAERARQVGATTLRSIGQISRMQRIADNDADHVLPQSMLAELREDNLRLTSIMRQVHNTCDEYHDVATASVLENWIDEAERRSWFLYEMSHAAPASNT